MPEYAKAWGITVRPTVIPATKSPTASSELYFGNHFNIGKRLYKIFLLNVFLERSCSQLFAHLMDLAGGIIFLPSSVTKIKNAK